MAHTPYPEAMTFVTQGKEYLEVGGDQPGALWGDRIPEETESAEAKAVSWVRKEQKIRARLCRIAAHLAHVMRGSRWDYLWCPLIRVLSSCRSLSSQEGAHPQLCPFNINP